MAYDISHSIPTNVAGVTAFPEAPAGFDVVNASPQARAVYGFPPAPDPVADPHGYTQWSRAMSAASRAKRYNGPLRAVDLKSVPMAAAPSAARNATIFNGVNRARSTNWSGIVNTTNVTAFSPTASFTTVASEFTVPVVQDAFSACDGAQHYEVSWNGIDGYFSGDVLQGGTLSGAACANGVTTTQYYAWVEWYPSYSVLYAFNVNPGDDIFVETFATGRRSGFVYVFDYTLQIFGSYALSALRPPYLIGDSAEYIVERPCCAGANPYPLANYVWNFWANNYANTGASTLFYPGLRDGTTFYVSMRDDGDTQTISHPDEVDGKYGFVMKDENCAYSGGCAP